MVESAMSLAELFPDGLHGKRIHAVGAGGSGISAALWLAREHGAIVSGCDVTSTSMSRLLNSHGIPVTEGHETSHTTDVDLVIVSPAVLYRRPDLPELTRPRERGVPVMKWQALLGFLMQGSIGVSVAGVHGKGSTTSLLGSLAIAGGLDPTVEVGATVLEWESNIRLGHGPVFINEADEFDYNFLYYHPRMVILTAVEYDHPEFFSSYEEIRDAFVTFLQGMDLSDRGPDAPAPTLVLNADDPGCLDVRARFGDWPGQVRTFGIKSEAADVRALRHNLESWRLRAGSGPHRPGRSHTGYSRYPLYLQRAGGHRRRDRAGYPIRVAAAGAVSVPRPAPALRDHP